MNSQWCRDEFVFALSQDKAIFIKLKLRDKQEKELNKLLLKQENAPINFYLGTRTYLNWSGEIKDKDFWRWIAYLLPHKKPESDKLDSNDIVSRRCCNLFSIFRKQKEIPDDEEGELFINAPLNSPADQPKTPEDIQLQIIHRNDHKDQDWYHPEFKSMQNSYLAMYNRTSMEGTFLVTNIPEAERSFGLYKDGSYIILRGGAISRDVTVSVIRKDESGENFFVSGIDQVFPSIFELVEHFKQNNLPGIDNTLVEAFKRCSINENKRCRRCSSKDGK